MNRQFSPRTVKTQFAVVPDSIVNDERLSLSDKGVALMLWATPNGWIFHPEEFATRTSNGIDAVKASLRRLEKAGYITRKKVRDENGVFVGADYVLNEKPEVENPALEKTTEVKNHGGKTHPNNNKDLITKHNLEQNTQKQEQGSLFADANELTGENEDELFPKRKQFPSADANEPTRENAFEAFWKAYPKCERKVGKAKCREIWKRNGLDRFSDAVMTALEIDSKSSDWTKENGNFIPMPQTWLNRKRYEDVQQPQEGASDVKPDSFSVLTYEDVSLGRSAEWDAWFRNRTGNPPKWSIRSREWVNANRDIVMSAERM